LAGERLAVRQSEGFFHSAPVRPNEWNGRFMKEVFMSEENGKKTGGGMTVREAGRKGGQKVRDQRGHSFYEEIGRKGGETVRNTRGRDFYEQIGHKGGQRVKELIEAGKKRAEGAEEEPTEPAEAQHEAEPTAAEDESEPEETEPEPKRTWEGEPKTP
jgi:general stress protein YciG